jgi:hypothetical protein
MRFYNFRRMANDRFLIKDIRNKSAVWVDCPLRAAASWDSALSTSRTKPKPLMSAITARFFGDFDMIVSVSAPASFAWMAAADHAFQLRGWQSPTRCAVTVSLLDIFPMLPSLISV